MLLLGSCFVEHIGHKLSQLQFKAITNPHGILFNPLSIANSLEDIVNKKKYTETDLVFHGELWHSFNHHGRFSAVSTHQILHNINIEIEKANQLINQSSVIVITFGSAWVYELSGQSKVVANCHKMPTSTFTKRLLQADEIVKTYERLFEHPLLKGKQVIFTLSPVRYVRDGLIENNRSKAVLLQAIHTLTAQLPQAYYFPSYEIVIDELRDYRFFENDLVHPNQTAIDYVWERFSKAVFDTNTQQFIQDMESLLSAAQHRPLHPDTMAYQSFCATNRATIQKMKNQYPEVDFTLWEKHFAL